jgi:hypothetical protein
MGPHKFLGEAAERRTAKDKTDDDHKRDMIPPLAFSVLRSSLPCSSPRRRAVHTGTVLQYQVQYYSTRYSTTVPGTVLYRYQV